MTSETKPKRRKAVRGRPASKADSDQMNQATGDEFEREGMGIAPKE